MAGEQYGPGGLNSAVAQDVANKANNVRTRYFLHQITGLSAISQLNTLRDRTSDPNISTFDRMNLLARIDSFMGAVAEDMRQGGPTPPILPPWYHEPKPPNTGGSTGPGAGGPSPAGVPGKILGAMNSVVFFVGSFPVKLWYLLAAGGVAVAVAGAGRRPRPRTVRRRGRGRGRA